MQDFFQLLHRVSLGTQSKVEPPLREVQISCRGQHTVGSLKTSRIKLDAPVRNTRRNSLCPHGEHTWQCGSQALHLNMAVQSSTTDVVHNAAERAGNV